MKSLLKNFTIATILLVFASYVNAVVYRFWFDNTTLIWMFYAGALVVSAISEKKRAKPKIVDPNDKGIYNYKCGHFSVLVDLSAQTVKLHIPQAANVYGHMGSVDLKNRKNVRYEVTMPLDGLHLDQVYQITTTKYYGNSYSGMVDGKFITLSGGETKSYEAPTGKSNIEFIGNWATDALAIADPKIFIKEKKNVIHARINNVRDSDIAEFKSWWSAFSPFIKAIKDEKRQAFQKQEAEAKASIAAKNKAKQEFEQQEKAAAKERANDRYRLMRQKSGVQGHFREWSLDANNAVVWSIAVDRDGKGFVTVGQNEWFGMMSGATATMVPAAKDTSAHLEILVEDPEFEVEHLTKRRLRLMYGENREFLQEWMDRINLLGKKTA